jgi:hypothetical protein
MKKLPSIRKSRTQKEALPAMPILNGRRIRTEPYAPSLHAVLSAPPRRR